MVFLEFTVPVVQDWLQNFYQIKIYWLERQVANNDIVFEGNQRYIKEFPDRIQGIKNLDIDAEIMLEQFLALVDEAIASYSGEGFTIDEQAIAIHDNILLDKSKAEHGLSKLASVKLIEGEQYEHPKLANIHGLAEYIWRNLDSPDEDHQALVTVQLPAYDGTTNHRLFNLYNFSAARPNKLRDNFRQTVYDLLGEYGCSVSKHLQAHKLQLEFSLDQVDLIPSIKGGQKRALNHYRQRMNLLDNLEGLVDTLEGLGLKETLENTPRFSQRLDDCYDLTIDEYIRIVGATLPLKILNNLVRKRYRSTGKKWLALQSDLVENPSKFMNNKVVRARLFRKPTGHYFAEVNGRIAQIPSYAV